MSILKPVGAGTPVAKLCHEHGMHRASFWQWHSRFSGMDASMMSRFKELEQENRRFKKMYDEERRKAEMIQDAITKK